MESYKIENLSFKYPERKDKALSNISFSVLKGEFITICGKSGCGKTTLLRLLKSAIAPRGDLEGDIFFEKKPLFEISAREQASKIGFVMQNPDNQIVTDKVWHEMAFGLESLGYSTSEIRIRVAEMASFFGIQNWFHKKVNELSGGQKQLLNLASVMVMQPSVIILDEPTAQLDPIAAGEFLQMLEKVNRELGTAVILAEHRLEDVFPVSDKIIVMDDGRIIACDNPENIGRILKNHDMYRALPAPVKIYGAVENGEKYPLTIRDGRKWLEEFCENHCLRDDLIPEDRQERVSDEAAVKLEDVWFRYEKNSDDVIKGLNIEIKKGELFMIVGGNGTGKTTALSIISGINKPYRGKVLINGESVSKIKNLYGKVLGVLPQNPQTLFVKKTVFLDLMEIMIEKKMSFAEKSQRIKNMSEICRIDKLLDSHPYDLSGGEQHRAALCKILLQGPEILLLDEPTKGMDAEFKEMFADILRDLTAKGVTVVMVSHDIEFCAQYADWCAMFFDGSVISADTPRRFFSGKSFYTTAAGRMAGAKLKKAVLTEDIILACGGEIKKREKAIQNVVTLPEYEAEEKREERKKLSVKRIIFGIVFAVLFVLTCVIEHNSDNTVINCAAQFMTILELGACLACFIKPKKTEIKEIQIPTEKRRLTKKAAAASALTIIAAAITIFVGMFYLEDRKYYFISLLIILETMIPFFMTFEGRKPDAREIILISALCAIASAGRAAFFMIPQFKPSAAIIIISGICFGGEAGFLVGAMTGFVSNFLFGQGPWTPWQMFAFGLIGFLSGILFKKGWMRKTKIVLCLFGALSVFVIYGGLVNISSVMIWQETPTVEMLVSACIMGAPFDLIHAVSTAFFLWFAAEPMIEKLDRIKIKFGIASKK